MLKIQSDRIIIDGHEPTKEQCETMTLLANALAKSDNFKTVEYRDGYAEFEKVGKADELRFIRNDISVYFDENIISVTAFGNTVTTSGNAILGGTNDGEYTVVLKDGYVIDTVTSINGNISNITETTFYAECYGGFDDITITSKSSVPRKSVDLTTLPGWANLSNGNHAITIVAKADGYRDSEPSAGVSVTKAFEPPTDCIVFIGETSDFTLKATNKEWDGTVEYSTDHNTWKVWNGGEITSVSGKLYLRGSGNTTFFKNNKGVRFVLSARAGCSGNLNTLLKYSNPPTILSKNECYAYMFSDCTNLTTAPALPATTLATGCYHAMFINCTNLTTAPALPATTLATYCYEQMFDRCTKLTTAPALPATTLATGCYHYMFWHCTNLTTAPALPATTLATDCYDTMFGSCSSLKVSSIQTGTYQYAWRIPTSGTASTKSGWNNNMLAKTGGTFTSNPSINTTYYIENEPV